MCAHCNRIRNEQGNWEEVASYISRRSEAVFSHTVCETCLRAHYPDTAERLGI